MKKLLALSIVLFPVIAFATPAPKTTDYDVPVHVTHSKLVLECGGGCVYQLHLIGTIAGTKVEIVDGTRPQSAVLHPGDYKARVVKTGGGKTRVGQASTVSSYEDEITYELLLPDGTKRQFMLVGEEE